MDRSTPGTLRTGIVWRERVDADSRGGGPKAEAGFFPPGVKDAKLRVPRPRL